MSFHDACMLCFLLESVVSLAVSCNRFERFFVPTLQGIAASIGTSNFFLRFDGLLLLSIFRIDEVDASVFHRCRALVLQQSIIAFPFSELLLTCQSKFQATSNQVWQLLESLQARFPDHKYPSGGFSFNKVNFVNPLHECDKLLFEATFQ